MYMPLLNRGYDAPVSLGPTLDLRRVYEAPFLERAGRLTGCRSARTKREEGGLAVTGYPRNGAPGHESNDTASNTSTSRATGQHRGQWEGGGGVGSHR